jgi:hypothetical protein
MEGYALGKDIQEIKDRLARIEERLGSGNANVPVNGPRGNEPIQTLGERTTLVVANRTFRDVHVQMTKDVHTGNWGPFQINHNQERDADSKKIDFGDKATFHVAVFRNDGGSVGELIGEFDHGVRYNALGKDDRLEFVIVDIGGETFLEALSLREGGRVALLLWLGARAKSAEPGAAPDPARR